MIEEFNTLSLLIDSEVESEDIESMSICSGNVDMGRLSFITLDSELKNKIVKLQDQDSFLFEKKTQILNGETVEDF